MELVLAILMGIGIFLVIPVIIGLSTVGIYLLNRRRALNTERVELFKNAVDDVESIIGETEYNQVSGSSAEGKNKDYVESK